MREQLDDLDFADNIALLSHSYIQMQHKIRCLEETAAKLGLSVSKEKTKVMRLNNINENPVSMSKGNIEEVSSFVYLGSVVNTDGGTDEDVKARIGKARAAYNILHRVWKARDIAITTKLRIFNTNVKSVLLYGSETWRSTKVMLGKVQAFTRHTT